MKNRRIGQSVEIGHFAGTVPTNSRIRRIGHFGLTELIGPSRRNIRLRHSSNSIYLQ
jgi:hypothetical protein